MVGHRPIIPNFHPPKNKSNAPSSLRTMASISSTTTSNLSRHSGYLNLLAAILPDPPSTPRRHTTCAQSATSPLATEGCTPGDASPVHNPGMPGSNTTAPISSPSNDMTATGSPSARPSPTLKGKRSLRFLHPSRHTSPKSTSSLLPSTPSGSSKKSRARLTRRKFSVPTFEMMLPPASSGGALPASVREYGEGEDAFGMGGKRWSNVPRLPELDFGSPGATPNLPHFDVGALAGPQSFRCDIHSPTSTDHVAAERECKQLILESGGRILTSYEYLGGFLYEMPPMTPNPLSTGDETALGGRIVVEAWTPFPEARWDGLRMHPWGGYGDICGGEGKGKGRARGLVGGWVAECDDHAKAGVGTGTGKWIDSATHPIGAQQPPATPTISAHRHSASLPPLPSPTAHSRASLTVPSRTSTSASLSAAQVTTARAVAMKRMGVVGPRDRSAGRVVEMSFESTVPSTSEAGGDDGREDGMEDREGVTESGEDEWESVRSEFGS